MHWGALHQQQSIQNIAELNRYATEVSRLSHIYIEREREREGGREIAVALASVCRISLCGDYRGRAGGATGGGGDVIAVMDM